jgi:hypothetical protein
MTASDYSELYKLFTDVTPLKQDCGVLCGGACCKGDENTGMRLFPHEETPLRVVETEGARYAVCGGACSREDRPLSCRIFPFFPTVDEKGKVHVVADLRAGSVCPLARHSEEVAFDPCFLRRVKKAGKLLARDAEGLAFLKEITREIEEVSVLTDLLNGADN